MPVSPGPSRPFRLRPSRVAPFLVSAALLIAISTQSNGFQELATARLGYLVPAVAQSLLLNVFLASLKLWILLGSLGIVIPFRRILRLILGLLATTFFTPFQTGHVLYGWALHKVEAVDTFTAFECIAYDKFLTLLGSLVLITIGWAFVPAGHILATWWVPAGSLALISLLFLIGFFRPALSRIRILRENSRMLSQPLSVPRKLLLLGLATLYQATDSVSMLLACWSMGIDVHPGALLAISQVVLLLSLAPFGISGLGIRENLMAFFFLGSLSFDQGIAAGLFVDFSEYVAPAAVGAIVLPSLLLELRRWYRTDPARGGQDPT